MLFRQLFDPASSTYTYLLADPASRKAVLVDTVFEQHARDAALVRELELELVYTLDTHCHADHVTGAWQMKRDLGSRSALAAVYGATNVDVPLAHGDVVRFGGLSLEVRATPGHTAGCLSFVTADRSMVFTGDALLVRGAGRTDFQDGDAERLFRSIREQLFTLPDACIVYPAHDYEGRTSSTIGEEKRWNPRIGGDARVEDFVGYMENLGLPHPKLMDIAVPANMKCGEPEQGKAPMRDPQWAHLTFTFAGIWELPPAILEEHLNHVQVVDVRERDEYEGPLGHIKGSRLIPLSELPSRASELARDTPVVAVCRSGARSAQAVVMLQKAGFVDVANLAGGMLRWRAESNAVEAGRD